LEMVSAEFPETLSDAFKDGFFNGFKKLHHGLRFSGSDVLLFFDFMGLPQIGKAADGELIERTEAEKKLFFEALPSMGALYAMYPVLVIPEVCEGVHPYFSSGWCSSEFYSALLSKQLHEYSSVAIDDFSTWLQNLEDGESSSKMSPELLQRLGDGTLSDAAVSEFLDVFKTDLERKKLFNEGDRVIIKSIVVGYLLQRRLLDAVSTGDAVTAQQLFREMEAEGAKAALSHAVDQSLDTLLHVAVKNGSAEMVALLLDAGADPQVRNLRGDTPSQLFMIPRCSKAAHAAKLINDGCDNEKEKKPLLEESPKM